METEFIYWNHPTSIGVQVEEICGGEDKSQKLWKAMALQVYGENGGDRYREIGHYQSGAPFLEDSDQRISISHTAHFMVIASLPRTPEADLSQFNVRTAMGIDAESPRRAQVLRIADRVMSPEEMALADAYAATLQEGDAHHPALPEEEAKVRSYMLAWTVKEALYKAALHEGADFRSDLRIISMPEICGNPMVKNPALGEAEITTAGGEKVPMQLFSYESEDHIVTIAYSPKAAKFKRS